MFLIQPGVIFGDFARSLGKHGISHVSLYVSGTDPFGGSVEEPMPTPLPAPALMLASGLAGFGALRLRARRRA